MGFLAIIYFGIALGLIVTTSSTHAQEPIDTDTFLDNFYFQQTKEPKANITNYVNYIKGLLFAANNFTLFPDPFPCTDLDKTKKFAMSIGENDYIRICDLCPYFPFDKYKNIRLTTQQNNTRVYVQENIEFKECVAQCTDYANCVAVSFSLKDNTCFGYNSTQNESFEEDEGYTTVIMNQPTGLIRDWMYSRNTKISWSNAKIIQDRDFLTCVNDCEKNVNCTAVSYEVAIGICSLFVNGSLTSTTDFVYGHLAAFKLNDVFSASQDHSWRYRRIHELKFNQNSENRTDDNLQGNHSSTQSEYDWIRNPACALQPLAGCDQSTGMQKCKYPENMKSSGDESRNLPICPGSRYSKYENVRKNSDLLQNCFSKCVSSNSCIAINYSESEQSCDLIDYEKMASSWVFENLYVLQTPSTPRIEFKFTAHRGMSLAGETGPSQVQQIKDLTACLEFCEITRTCTRASFNFETKICSLDSNYGTAGIKSDQRSVTFFKRPNLNSIEIGFTHLPGTEAVGISSPTSTTNHFCCTKNCQSEINYFCLAVCLNKTDCDFLGISIVNNNGDNKIQFPLRLTCTLHNENSVELIKKDGRTEVYVKKISSVNSLKFTQESLDSIGIFQQSDFYSCFRKPVDQTLSSLGGYQNELTTQADYNGNQISETTTAVELRTSRGFFSFLKKAFNTVVNAVVDTVKDVVNTIVKTGETVVKVFQGDFKGAIDKFMEIPIVKDVKNVVDSGIEVVNAIASGDGKRIGEGLLNLGANSVGLIPIPGGKVGGKLFKNTLKKSDDAVVKSGNKSGKKEIQDKTKNSKKEEQKKKNDESDGQECKNKERNKRATARAAGGKRPRPDCDDDDKDKNKFCTNKIRSPSGVQILVPNMDKGGSGTCAQKKALNGRKANTCSFRCNPGYDEKSTTPVCELRNNEGQWDPNLQCSEQSCGVIEPITNTASFSVKVPNPQKETKEMTAYYVKYSLTKKLPIYSVALHDPINFMVKVKRDNKFRQHPCKALEGKQLDNDNYLRSGWDKGHLTPFEAMAFSRKSALSSNMFVNVAPQHGYTNSVPWGGIENHVHCFLKKKPGLVMTGICPETQNTTKLQVPECYWKLICYKENGQTRVVGFVAQNSNTTDKVTRLNDTMTLRSQGEVIRMIKSTFSFLFSPSLDWGEGVRAFIKDGRPGMAGIPLDCANIMDLPVGLKERWDLDVKNNSGKDYSKPKKPKKKSKRSTTSEERFGCSKEELREYLAFISSIGTDEDEENNKDEDDDEVEEETENDDENSNIGLETFSSASCGKRLIGYFPSWGTSRFTNVQGRSLTHVVFAFFETRVDGSIVLGSADPVNSQNLEQDKETSTERLANFQRITKTFNLKAMFAVGGWENSQYFSGISGDPTKRLKFIASTIQILDQYDWQGIDIDWEHPVTGGAVNGVPEDKGNYVTLLRELRQALDEHRLKNGKSEKYLISFAGAAGQWTLDPGLDLPNMLKYADWANVMTYDYFGAWASKWGAYTGPPAPLYFGNPKGFSGKVNVHWTMKYYVCKTHKPHQINMGVPLYGRFWKNVGDPIDPSDDMWRKAEAVGGKFEGGFVPWKEIKSKWLTDSGFTVKMHPKAKVPYAWNPTTKTFLGFENPESLKRKVQYAEENNLGGLMIWAIDQDDEDYTMLATLLKADLCKSQDTNKVTYRCPPIDEKRWWTPEDGYDKAGMCGKSAPLYKGYYPVCDSDDPGYSCCGAFGFCGTGPDFCTCPTCVDYLTNPERIIEEPTKPTIPVAWHFSNAPDGQRGRCGRGVPLVDGKIPICNPDDPNAHCCSNGGYCGATAQFCECDGCIDFKKNPNYQFKPKTWWEWADGSDKAGRCGSSAPKLDGNNPGCNPDSTNYCCSKSGWCGHGSDFCDCEGCVNYKK